MSARLSVVLIRPKEDGNIGAVARAARNFGAERLVLVAPRGPVGAEARRRAMGGLPLLRAAQRAPTLSAALETADLVVGTTDLSTGRSRTFLRRSVSPERMAEIVAAVDGEVAIVFGPEDNGLSREELAACDLLVHIPARREFPTLNLSHAAAIVLYALHRALSTRAVDVTTPAPEVIELNGREKELFLARLASLLPRLGYPAHKRRGLILLIRRTLGRSTPSEAEYRMLLGFLKLVDRAVAERRHGTHVH